MGKSKKRTHYPALLRSPMEGAHGSFPLLKKIKCMFIEQSLEPLDVGGTDIPYNAYYAVCDVKGNRMYYAGEVYGFFGFCCLGGARPFEIFICNDKGEICMKVKRKLTYGTYCLSGTCFGSIAEIYVGDYEYLGRIKQNTNCSYPNFRIEDTEGKEVLELVGAKCTCCCPSCAVKKKTSFSLYDAKGNKIGRVKKNWVMKDLFTNDQVFGMSFPEKLKIGHKTLLLGASWLILFQFYEHNLPRMVKDNAMKRITGCNGCAFVIFLIVLGGVVFAVLFLMKIIQF